MIRLLFQNATISVNINNQAPKPFARHRGVCQACPLASYLFIIVLEALNVADKNAARIAMIKGIFLPQFTQQIISQYVDNTSFPIRVEEVGVDNMVEILHKFGLASSLEINWHKSMAYWGSQGIHPG